MNTGTAFLCTRARDGFLLGQGISTSCYVVFLWVSSHCSASSPALISCLFIFLIKPFVVPADSVTTDWLQPQIPTQRSGPCPPRSKAASPQANPVSVPLGLLCRAHHVPPVWGCWRSLLPLLIGSPCMGYTWGQPPACRPPGQSALPGQLREGNEQTVCAGLCSRATCRRQSPEWTPPLFPPLHPHKGTSNFRGSPAASVDSPLPPQSLLAHSEESGGANL